MLLPLSSNIIAEAFRQSEMEGNKTEARKRKLREEREQGTGDGMKWRDGLRWWSCGSNVRLMSTHCNVLRFTSGGKTAVWPARTASAQDKNDKHFMRAFEDGGFITVGLQPWRSPSEDLAPRHLLVSHCIMSSSSVHACLCLGVCIGESPRQQANKDCAAIWKYVWCGRHSVQVKQSFFASKYFVFHFFSVDSVLFCSLKDCRDIWKM